MKGTMVTFFKRTFCQGTLLYTYYILAVGNILSDDEKKAILLIFIAVTFCRRKNNFELRVHLNESRVVDDLHFPAAL